MVGNHDWYYHLEGSAFDEIRRKIIDSLGLSNSFDRFPYELDEYPLLHEIMGTYKVFGRHGDYYDKFNFNREKGRDHATLGDIFTMDVCNRYPVEVQKRYGDKLSHEDHRQPAPDHERPPGAGNPPLDQRADQTSRGHRRPRSGTQKSVG